MQSSSAVTVFGISLAAVGVLSVDQTIMIMYGSLIGSGAILYVLSTGLVGRSRQVAMYLVGYNVLICAVLVPLLYFEIHAGVPWSRHPRFPWAWASTSSSPPSTSFCACSCCP